MLKLMSSCASTILQYQWQATSFPFMPASNLMIFDDNCGNDSQILSKSLVLEGFVWKN